MNVLIFIFVIVPMLLDVVVIAISVRSVIQRPSTVQRVCTFVVVPYMLWAIMMTSRMLGDLAPTFIKVLPIGIEMKLMKPIVFLMISGLPPILIPYFLIALAAPAVIFQHVRSKSVGPIQRGFEVEMPPGTE